MFAAVMGQWGLAKLEGSPGEAEAGRPSKRPRMEEDGVRRREVFDVRDCPGSGIDALGDLVVEASSPRTGSRRSGGGLCQHAFWRMACGTWPAREGAVAGSLLLPGVPFLSV